MEDNLNSIIESERSSVEEHTDSHCKVLISTVGFYKNFIYILSFFGFFGLAFIIGEYLDKTTEIGDGGILFLSVFASAFITVMNILTVRVIYAFINVIAEIARNTREIKNK